MSSKGRPYRRIIVDGFEILIGRGAQENDSLSFGVAAATDSWLHVAGGTPGSHVVIRNPERIAVPRAVVERAASHAAWFSKAKNAAWVEVHYCQVSDLRKLGSARTPLTAGQAWGLATRFTSTPILSMRCSGFPKRSVQKFPAAWSSGVAHVEIVM